MTKTIEFEKKTKELIDNLKSVCANYGLGNDGNEFKIITQIFLYKFLNDKFIHEIKLTDKKLAKLEPKELDAALNKLKADDYEMLTMQLNENTARLRPKQFISYLFANQNKPKFAELFDKTLLDIAKENSDIFSVVTEGGEKVVLFENISKYVTDKRDDFCKAIINKLVNFSFENIFHEKFDFYATIFEYLIKDYNTNSGGKYAEYFTPHAVAKIMAKCLVQGKVKNVTCYDPSAGSGTLLMNLAHEIGEDKCTIYSQDISQKSSNLLRLNLILNNLVHSIPNVVKGNTLLDPYHKDKKGKLQKFDFVVSNPPFKLDFSEYSDQLNTKENHERFFAGIPKVPAKEKTGMAIYVMFVQHIMYSLSENGRAAIVVPTGFITAQTGIEKKIRERLVEAKMLRGAISMPSNLFAKTGTSVSILFLDKGNTKGNIVLMDASKLGETIKLDNENQRTVLSDDEQKFIIETFNAHESIEDFSVLVSYEQIKDRNYSLSAGQYFEVKIGYNEISARDFNNKLKSTSRSLSQMFKEGRSLEESIESNLLRLIHG
jgi:type I restriction enzyme M protein